ncbi:MAG TPA: hypothetical protein VMZ53_11170 [Kofleriaceae bacterium]|nr:hypothetical protein [Kofleriaceae bacterium]
MRFAPTLIGIVFVVAGSRAAHAERVLSLDFGYLQNQIAVTDQTSIEGSFARFGIKMSGRYLHAGAEAEEGWLTGQTWEAYGYVARADGSTPEPTQSSPLTGNTLALKTFAGAHTTIGALTLGADLALGFRDTWVSSDRGMDVAGRKNERLLEARTRIDYWLSPQFTLGFVASTDLNERRDTSVGAILAIHFPKLGR